MRVLVFPWAVFCVLSISSAQEWQHRFGGVSQDRGTAVRQTNDGGYIAAGFTSSFGAGYRDFYLVRTDAHGDTLWTRCYGGDSNDMAVGVCPAPDSGFLVAGYTTSFGNHDVQFYLIRTDSRGDTLWTRTYAGADGAGCYSICASTSGGWVLAGNEYTGSANGIRLVAVADNGDTLWTRTHVLGDAAVAFCIEPVTGGGYIVGSDEFAGTVWDMLLMRINDSGDTLWTKAFGGVGRTGARGVSQTRDGGFIVVGYTDSHGAGGDDVYLIRTDSSGETLWTRTFGGSGDDIGWAIETTSDGGFAIAAQLIDSGTCLMRLDSAGTPLWTRGYGGDDTMVAYDLWETSDHGFILTGDIGSDLGLVKTDSAGNAAVQEIPEAEVGAPICGPTVVRAVLRLEEGASTSSNPSWLLDAAGRKVVELHPGANDVRALAPGIYFVREAQAHAHAQSVEKIIIAR